MLTVGVMEAAHVTPAPEAACDLGPPWPEERLQARLVDGRAIHFHLQFVEPAIRRSLGLLPLPPGAGVERVTLEPGVDLAVAAVWAAGLRRPEDGQSAALAGALSTLDGLGLRFFVDLAVGLVVFRRCPGPLPPLPARTLVLDEAVSAGPTLAGAVLRGAAGEWIRQWMQVESGLDLSAPLAPGLAELMSEFGSAVVHELILRWEEHRDAARGGARRRPCPIEPPRLSRRPSEVLDWLDRLPGVPLAKELFCCWYPHWRRTDFILDSPFDHLVDLPPAPGPDKPFSEVLELHRRGLRDRLRA
ncbi:MAG: hypothetical protein ACRD0C_17075 [Acidimicrobiia bacterium]